MYYHTIQNQMCDVKQLKTEENNSTDVHGPQQINHHVLIQSGKTRDKSVLARFSLQQSCSTWQTSFLM